MTRTDELVDVSVPTAMKIEALGDGRWVVAALITFKLGDETFQHAGAAVCDPADEYDPKTGGKLAIGRALRDIGKQMLRDARKG